MIQLHNTKDIELPERMIKSGTADFMKIDAVSAIGLEVVERVALPIGGSPHIAEHLDGQQRAQNRIEHSCDDEGS